MSETIEGLRNMFLRWKEAFECDGLKVDLGKTTFMVSVASQRMACLKVRFIHVWLAARE